MNREDIEHMWKVASNNPNHDTNWHDPVVIRFAALVASAEREACAKVVEDYPYWLGLTAKAEISNAIRARSNT